MITKPRKCILKCLISDPETGEKTPFEEEYNGIPEACSHWASGYKHSYLYECRLFYADTGTEIPYIITDRYYDRYYYGRYDFDENGDEIGKRDWTFLHIQLYYGSREDAQICPKKTGILLKKKYHDPRP